MKKLFTTLICIGVYLVCICQTVELRTNGYTSKFTKIDTLFFSEYSLSGPEKKSSKKEDFNAVNLKYTFGLISRPGKMSGKSDPLFTTSFYLFTDGTLQAPTSQLFFKPKDIATFRIKYGYLGSIEAHPSLPGYYFLYTDNKKYNTGESIFELCNRIYNENAVSVVEPVYNRLVKTTNPLRPWEWNIRNTGVVNGSTVGADMGVEGAWCYSTGTGIRVAIIDDGVDLVHPDLQANLLPGYDATGNNSGGAPTPDNGHGTNCAGIIASVNNNIGTIGVAFNARIIPIRMGIVTGNIFNTNDTWIANCFAEALNRGADVISNSWGGGSPSAQIDAAIQNAVTNGRGGNGSVVLFAAGNNNGAVIYPATNANVIAVGASTPCDTRKRPSSDPEGVSCDGEWWWGSNFGTSMDILAPGVLITTTDNVGSNGFTPEDYNSSFNGTSSACPNAAAVIALIFGANNSLTGTQARNLLEQNCFKIPNGNFQANVPGQPNGTWSTQAGYGRVDADRAVRAAMGIGPLSISGPSTICSPATSGTFTVSNLSACGVNTINWSTNVPQVTVSPQTGTPTTLTANGYSGLVVLTATVNNPNSSTTTLTQQVYIGGAPDCHTRSAYWYVNGYQTTLNKCSYLTQIRSISQRIPGTEKLSFYEYYANAWVVDPIASSIAWSYVSSSGYTSWTANGNQAEVTINTNSPNGWIRLRCTTSNGCGSYSWDFWFTPQGSTASCPVYFDPNCLLIDYKNTNDIQASPDASISLSPNPTSGQFSITLNSTDKKDQIREVIVENKMGTPVFRQQFNNLQRTQIINLAGKPADIYTVRIFTGKTWITKKLSLFR